MAIAKTALVSVGKKYARKGRSDFNTRKGKAITKVKAQSPKHPATA